MSKRARTIALDTLGSDHGEADIVKGSLESLDEGPHKIVLVGREARLRRYLRHFGYSHSRRSRITIAHASDEITMSDKPRDAIRNKNSSIHVGAQLVKDGGAEALISAGNTGVVMATAKLATTFVRPTAMHGSLIASTRMCTMGRRPCASLSACSGRRASPVRTTIV